jgi:hypothetical protein
MPTEPINSILPPIDPRISSALQRFYSLIDETTYFGTHVMAWHMQAALGGDEVAPVTLSLRHILELSGAISSCMKNSNIDPCKILLRSTLESFLGIAYILKDDSIRRGHAFLTVESYQRLKRDRLLDGSTPEGREFNEAIGSDTLVPNFSHGIPAETIKKSIHNIEDFLDTSDAKDALNELRKLKKKGIKNPNWYTLYNGPYNLERLATLLGYQLLYIICYKYWSRTVHGTDIVQGKLHLTPSGRPGILQLRNPDEAQTITQILITILLTSYRLLIDKYCPEKKVEFANWYKIEIKNNYEELAKQTFIKLTIPTAPA